jgi:hypothetical protein
MPIALSPKQTFEVWLDCDADEPMESRPVFIARHLTAEDVMVLHAEADKARACKTYGESLPILDAALAKHVTGWRNMVREGQPVPFGKCSSVCSEPELFELAVKLVQNSELSEDAKKKSRSRPKSAGAASATTAAPPASASTESPAATK